MPLQLPQLDDRRYADLVAEARRLIAVHDPAWTNHNPSDPGITLVELFAYLTEMLLYRVDRVTAESQLKFLKLLNGPDWTPGPVLGDDIRDTVVAVRARERAVTAADFERLSTQDYNRWLGAMQRAEQAGSTLDEWWRVTRLNAADPAHQPSQLPTVARASCVPARNLDRGTETERTDDAPAHVSVIVLPDDPALLQPPATLRTALWGYLDERRTLTVRHHVVGPYLAPISAEIVLATVSGAVPAAVIGRVVARLTSFLDGRVGGVEQHGWPFGRDVYISELHEQMETVEGVDFITDVMLTSACAAGQQRCAPARPLWHAEGDLVGMALAPHQLPQAQLAAANVIAAPATRFVRIELALTLQVGAGGGTLSSASLKQRAKALVRGFFHPLHGGPGPASAAGTDLLLSNLRPLLAALPGVTGVGIDLQADPMHLLWLNGQLTGLRIKAGDVVNWHVRVAVMPG